MTVYVPSPHGSLICRYLIAVRGLLCVHVARESFQVQKSRSRTQLERINRYADREPAGAEKAV